jgi:predicted Zn-dependent peptidase
VASSLEAIGGSLNAFTTREQTCFTARVLDEHLVDAVDILSDITCNATMTPLNMNRERQVICEEIKESQDNPSDHIHDLFAQAHWSDHPLGRPIMGTLDTILAVKRGQLRRFMQRHYRTNSVVVAASGSVSHDRLVRLAREKFSFVDGLAEGAQPAQRKSGRSLLLKQDDNSQTQFCLGFPSLAYHDRRRMVLMVLSAYLGGGMSSVLFQKIREQRGLAYSVFTFNDFYRDAGVFGIYLGTDQVHLREAFDVIINECRRLKRTSLRKEVLNRVKEQLKGQFTLTMESTSVRMHRIGRLELMIGTYQTLDETIKAIDAVTSREVRDLANELFDEDQISIAALGPMEPSSFDDIAATK